jgi:hypothetical protein
MLVSSYNLSQSLNYCTRLISFTKNGSNQRSILSVYGPKMKLKNKIRKKDDLIVEQLSSVGGRQLSHGSFSGQQEGQVRLAAQHALQFSIK